MAHEIEEPTLWGNDLAPPAYKQANYLQGQPGGPPGYRLRRIILVNFWLYDVQEFDIPHGRLFLAGENASGKSTVLMSAIPMVLDGNHRPERIDTFGKREKRIDYYILGSNESATPFTHNQRTSYVALEFEWCAMDTPPFASELRARWERGEYEQARFLTLGLAFVGNRNNTNPITTTRFLITDGSRLTTTPTRQNQSHTLSLVQKTTDGIQAIDIRTFRKQLSEHGVICESASDYEQRVSQALFHFSNIQDFRRLIRQLLYLRQPNLNSVLSLETIRAFLNQSLPQIPLDILQHAASTLETMDNLYEEIERRKRAYNAIEKLHLAQEALTLAHVHLAVCEYIYKQFQEEKEQNNVRRLKTNLTRATNELGRCKERLQTLDMETDRVTGELQALQNSQGLQAAQNLKEVSEKASRLESERQTQQRLLEDIISNRELAYTQTVQQEQDFIEAQQESIKQLQQMQETASQRAHWEQAAEQAMLRLTQVQRFTLEHTTPDISAHISSLLDTQVTERQNWLRSLSELHRTIEHETSSSQTAKKREEQIYDELDKATRFFEEEREQILLSQQNLVTILDSLKEDENDLFLPIDYFHELHEHGFQLASEVLPPHAFLTQFQTLLEDYQTSLRQANKLFTNHSDRLSTQLTGLQRQQGARSTEVSLAEEAYRLKLAEPEFTPQRNAYRIQARAQLARQQIPAFPLYMLLDFTPPITDQYEVMGRIERILEDAGLLDALVVLPEHTATADTFLATQELSDCRLDIERLLAINASTPSSSSLTVPLCMDPAIYETLGTAAPVWEHTIKTILTIMQRTIFVNEQQPGNWKHGLLIGQASNTSAHCIGKATRVREQQRAQAELRQRWQTLQAELQQITEQITALTEQLTLVQKQQTILTSALSESALESHILNLRLAQETLERTHGYYEEARKETQRIHQRISHARIQLQRECGDIVQFSSNIQSIDQAQEAIHHLLTKHQALYKHIDNLQRAWNNHREASKRLGQAKTAEFRALQACESKEKEARVAQSELTTLQQLVRETSGEDIITRLKNLQIRHDALPQERGKEHEAYIRTETTIKHTQSELQSAQETFERAQQHCTQTRETFITLLTSYPIEHLQFARQRLEQQRPLEIAQKLLDTPLSAAEEDYQARKIKLEQAAETAYNNLFVTFNQVSNLLHEYGPTFQSRGSVIFVNADSANPFLMLNQLGDEITHQESLLDEKERNLFRDFMLKEMADTIRHHILEAENWIDRLNTMLGHTSIIEERYHLKWVSKNPEVGQAGSYLAAHHAQLRRQAQALKPDEVEALVYAFRQEAINARAQLQENNGSSFIEALAEIFDYRQWFRFEITIIQTDGQRQQLNERALKQRSGAEQYVALYIPFFAALSALYESAGKGAPRLIALDEAFDKVSAGNTQKLLKFLTAQNFQWIMSGPRLSGEGTEIPACVRYLMLHKKGSELATGFASFWSHHQLAPDQHNGKEQGSL